MSTLETEITVKVRVTYDYTPGTPAYTEGPPERWEPECPAEVELLSVVMVGDDWGLPPDTTIEVDVTDMLPKEALNAIREQCVENED